MNKSLFNRKHRDKVRMIEKHMYFDEYISFYYKYTPTITYIQRHVYLRIFVTVIKCTFFQIQKNAENTQ